MNKPLLRALLYAPSAFFVIGLLAFLCCLKRNVLLVLVVPNICWFMAIITAAVSILILHKNKVRYSNTVILCQVGVILLSAFFVLSVILQPYLSQLIYRGNN